MRVDVKKLLFFGLKDDKEAFFKEAQKQGMIHFIEVPYVSKKDFQEDLQLYIAAIKILRMQPSVEQEEINHFSHAHPIAEEIVNYKHTLDKIEEEIRITNLDIHRVQIFGDFSLEDLRYIHEKGNRIFQFFCAKKGLKVKDDPELIYINSDHALDYFVSISPKQMSYEGMIEMKIETPVGALRNRLAKAEREKSLIEHKLQSLARYNQYLHRAMKVALNQANLKKAKEGTQSILNGSLFAATGWVPENKITLLQESVANLGMSIEEVAIEPKDAVPTYLENTSIAKIGEDVIGIYDTPSTTDKDPSLWVLLAFAIFFAIILGDGGYGAVLLGLALYLRYKYPSLKGLKKRVLNLLMIISTACIIWGVLSSSFFGLSVGPENPLRNLSLVTYLAEKKADYHHKQHDKVYEKWAQKYPEIADAHDGKEILFRGYTEKFDEKSYELLALVSDQILMELALFIGVVHLLLGLVRYLRKNYVNIGWIIFLLGAYLYFPFFLNVPSFVNYLFHVPLESAGYVGKHLILIGIPTAVVLSVIKHGLLGLTEIMNLIQVFADGLSYLRLYALGLSGAILSATINEMAAFLPFVLASVLILSGHAVNMLLGVMGGVIHGLRLNFLEWYHYSFEGGGRKFKPLELTEIE